MVILNFNQKLNMIIFCYYVELDSIVYWILIYIFILYYELIVMSFGFEFYGKFFRKFYKVGFVCYFFFKLEIQVIEFYNIIVLFNIVYIIDLIICF